MGLPLKNTDLALYRKRTEIILATADQIKKDFEIFGEEIKFSGNVESAYNELLAQITPVISNLVRNNFEKFLSVLYRIDISEKMIRKISSRSLLTDEQVAEMILERELQKVITRTYFREKK